MVKNYITPLWYNKIENMFSRTSHFFLLAKQKISRLRKTYGLKKRASFFVGHKKNIVFASGANHFPSAQATLLVRKKLGKRKKTGGFTPLQSFLVSKKKTWYTEEQRFVVASAPPVLLEPSGPIQPHLPEDTQESAPSVQTPASSDAPDSSPPPVHDKNKRTFLKAAGFASVGLIASLFLPKKAEAFVLGSAPTTGVVGVKNVANARINPATEETLGGVLKTTDLTFDAGALTVKVTSLPSGGSSSFSDSGDVAKSALVDADRHVQVDVLSSALPTSASTETTLQTIAFGGFKFALRLATVGSVDYVGEAAIGTATSAASWRIKKVDSTSGISITWAGTGSFNQVWDNYASLIYS